jgi:hypothetical protein
VLTEHFREAGVRVTAFDRMFPFVAVFELAKP